MFGFAYEQSLVVSLFFWLHQATLLDRASKQVVAIYKAEMDAMHAAGQG